MISTENDLATHDIALYVGPKTGHNTRQLRVLLLSPSTVSEHKLERTVERIQHLAHLTGAQDIAIAFLVSPPAGAQFASARTLVGPAEHHGTNGMLAYCKLQAELISHTDLNVPILPLPTLEALPAFLQSQLAAIAGPIRVQPPVTTPFHLLQHCTAAPPLRRDTAFLLSDTFENVKDLAEGCCMVLSSAPEFSSSSSFEEPISGSESEEDARKKLKQLRDLIDTNEWENLVVFWQKEWAME